MNKQELLKLVDELNLPKTDYYILSSGSMIFYGLRKDAKDLDLCVSNELFEQLKEKYNLKEDDKNKCRFYQIIPKSKKNFKMNYRDGYPIECLVNILEYKLKRNAPKDQKDIEMIKSYLKENDIKA